MDPLFAYMSAQMDAAFAAHQRAFDAHFNHHFQSMRGHSIHDRTSGRAVQSRSFDRSDRSRRRESYRSVSNDAVFPPRNQRTSSAHHHHSDDCRGGVRNAIISPHRDSYEAGRRVGIQSRAGARRTDTLRREGIQPDLPGIGSRSRCVAAAGSNGKRDTDDFDVEAQSPARWCTSLGSGWYQAIGAGTITHRGLHSIFQAAHAAQKTTVSSRNSSFGSFCSTREPFLCLFEPKTREGKRACLHPQHTNYTLSCHAKCFQDAQQKANFVFGCRPLAPTTGSCVHLSAYHYFLLSIDIKALTATLCHCHQSADERELLSSNLESVRGLQPNKFFHIHVSISTSDTSRIKCRINDEDIFDYHVIADTDADHESSVHGLPGVLCQGGSRVLIKDWKVCSDNGSRALSQTVRSNESIGNSYDLNDAPKEEESKEKKRQTIGSAGSVNRHVPTPTSAVRLGDSVNAIKQHIIAEHGQLPFDSKLIDAVLGDLIIGCHDDNSIGFDDIVGLENAKQVLMEAVVMPLLAPELFTGLRRPWKGVLLFGPPGTGKTMLARATAASQETAFFSSSASSLVSKWHGESEKLVKCLFTVARYCAPAVVFLDEVDALVSARGSAAEHEASRRLKAQLLSSMDGLNAVSTPPHAATSGANTLPPVSNQVHGHQQQMGGKSSLVMVLAATNCPWDLDTALLRRLEKRIYVPLPDLTAKQKQFERALESLSVAGLGEQGKDVNGSHERNFRCAQDMALELAKSIAMDGFSCADIHSISRDAAMMSVRRMMFSKQDSLGQRTKANNVNDTIQQLRTNGKLEPPQVTYEDFCDAIAKANPSIPSASIARYEEWNRQHGTG